VTDPLFLALVKRAKLPMPVPEYRFAPPRRWRCDYAWPDQRVALEVEGGIFTRGRHSRGAGMLKDMEKYNTLAVMGWRLIRCTPTGLRDLATVQTLADALRFKESA
jgi:very-short-patch-repair endonuclease